MHAADQLQQSIDRTGSIAVVGLDPRVDLVPPPIREHALARADGAAAVAAAFEELNRGIIDVVAGRCAAVKLQTACYEAYGPPGWEALARSVEHARTRGIPIVVDAKRNDIGSTAVHYREAFFDGGTDFAGARTPAIRASWLTVNGYLGRDGIVPFLDASPDASLGIFVLVRTSNPSSSETQGLPSDGTTVAARVAGLVAELGAERRGRCGLSDVGAVVGATHPAEARLLREAMPDTLFLVPGYGAQGATAADAVAGARADGRGIVVNSSRGIVGAWRDAPDATDWQAAVRAALDAMNDDLARAAR